MRDVAFYAPMKPPSHPVPSGDRAFARALQMAIQTEDVTLRLVSELQSHDKVGDPDRQATLAGLAKAEVERLTNLLRTNRPDFWVTYHNYYKAPDLIGPAVCAALDLPYIQIEASRAKKRLNGPWAQFAAAAEKATDAADLVFYLTAHDEITLARHKPINQRLTKLSPFLPYADLPTAAACDTPGRPILSVGMMRAGDKLASYHLIAETLACLTTPDWNLQIAGDGPIRDQIEKLMSVFGTRVRFLGQLDASSMRQAYDQAGLFFWPGVNEGFGMVYLEAQAAGLPVVAQDRPGVRDVLAPGFYPAIKDGPAALAAQIDSLLANPVARLSCGTAARASISDGHLIDSARATFWTAVTSLLDDRT